jgi:hypothetical protein
VANAENNKRSDKISVSIRIERVTWNRFRVAATAQCRSAASLLRVVIRDTGDDHERTERGHDRDGRGGGS